MFATSAHPAHPVYLPRPPEGSLRSLVLAILVHLLLLAALTWGISWNRQVQDLAVEAELWAAVPQQAAPKLAEPAPAPKPAAVVPPPPARDAQIAVEQEKRREAQRKQAIEQARKQEQLKREVALQKERDKEKAREKANDKARELADQQKRQQQIEEQQEKRLQAEREQNIRRMLGQAGTSTNPESAGAAVRSAGPSSSYAGRIRARIKPNIVYADDAPGNPVAEVELRVAPDGSIVGRRLVKPSGVRAWDDAVLKAIDKTETLPRDVDGQIPSTMVIVFRPKE